ncbi:hypothetical protein HK101_010757 [Irineochytrium annulatum]|nr:hypothetical protein HK101_010757 [Irineochytrium annulatum]
MPDQHQQYHPAIDRAHQIAEEMRHREHRSQSKVYLNPEQIRRERPEHEQVAEETGLQQGGHMGGKEDSKARAEQLAEEMKRRDNNGVFKIYWKKDGSVVTERSAAQAS